jgi:hypothetical protein
MQTKTEQNQPSIKQDKTNGQSWESFPKPRGWSVDWAREGLIQVKPKTATK